ncbi:LuxR C-terminal-related transcriptional regulator [Microbacterium sp. NPDC055357]
MGAAPTTLEVDAQLVARAVDQLTRRTRFPVAFGGFERDGAVHISAIAGARTRHLEGLVVQAGRGLGGRALVERRPRLALDYRSSRVITHDYDRAVLGEGIATLFAVPVLVGGRARGVLYCGSWSESPVGDVVTGPAFDIASDLATELRVRDEVERRLAAAMPPTSAGSLSGSAREELRQSYVELRTIASSVSDSALRGRLEHVERRLAALSAETADTPAEPDVRLSRRETDVLACAAVGSRNAEIAVILGLKEVTVKSYLQSAMAKLDVSSRHAAVVKARRAGILP